MLLFLETQDNNIAENAEESSSEGNVVKIEDVITIDPETEEVELNHGRIGKIENLEPLVNLKR